MKNDTSRTQLAVIANDVSYIKADVEKINDALTRNYITREEFEPIKRIVYGVVTLILVGVVGALLALVLQR